VRYLRENFPYLVAFVKYPEEVRPYIYTTNQLKRAGKEVKRRTKTIEVFSSEGVSSPSSILSSGTRTKVLGRGDSGVLRNRDGRRKVRWRTRFD
jgi:transposase-like protein